MTLRVRLTEQADADVLDIWQYIAANNESAADQLVDRFTETYNRLARNPRMGLKQDHYRPGLRCFPSVSTSSSTESLRKIWKYTASCTARADWKTCFEITHPDYSPGFLK